MLHNEEASGMPNPVATRVADTDASSRRYERMNSMSGLQTRIEKVQVRHFLSLVRTVQVSKLPAVTVLGGANASAKSNFVRFFEMLSWKLNSGAAWDAALSLVTGEADVGLFGGSKQTHRLEASVSIRTKLGLNDYKFVLTHAHPDRLIFTEEALRFSRAGYGTEADWQHLHSGHNEARIVEAAQLGTYADFNLRTASVLVHLLGECGTYQSSRHGWRIVF